MCQQIGQPRRNGHISGNTAVKTESRRNNLNRLITISATEFVIKKKKTFSKLKSTTGWLHRGILPNI